MRNGRSNISLRGSGHNSGGIYLHGSSHAGVNRSGRSEYSDKQYFDFKQYIITNFLNPIMRRDFDVLRKNVYNFDYVVDRLNMFKNNRNKSDVEFMLNVVQGLRYSTNVQMSYDDIRNEMHKSGKVNRITFETTRIILQAQYEIYNLLFGVPNKENPQHEKYQTHMLNDIKVLLDTYPGILFDQIKERLYHKYSTRFI